MLDDLWRVKCPATGAILSQHHNLAVYIQCVITTSSNIPMSVIKHCYLLKEGEKGQRHKERGEREGKMARAKHR